MKIRSGSVDTHSNQRRRWNPRGKIAISMLGMRSILPLTIAAMGGKQTDAEAASRPQNPQIAAIEWSEDAVHVNRARWW